jgi:hypothetical protein
MNYKSSFNSDIMTNYNIIGSDGKEYGPVTAADMRQWIATSRINAQSQAKAEGDAEFRPLAKFPEFADAFTPQAAGTLTPPPLGSTSSTPSTPVKTSGLAVTSLVLGILGVITCGVTALVGLILGIVAMVKVKNSGGKLGGNGIALAGVIVSAIFLAIFLFLIPFFAAMLLPALAAAKEKAQSINCVNNEKQLALAIRIYSSDNRDQLPPAATWCDAIKVAAGTEKIFQCPAANAGRRCDYAFNAKLGGLDLEKVAPDTVMLFEADRGWNANGGPELMLTQPRHTRMFVVALVDGSVQQVSSSQLATLRWNP